MFLVAAATTTPGLGVTTTGGEFLPFLFTSVNGLYSCVWLGVLQ